MSDQEIIKTAIMESLKLGIITGVLHADTLKLLDNDQRTEAINNRALDIVIKHFPKLFNIESTNQ